MKEKNSGKKKEEGDTAGDDDEEERKRQVSEDTKPKGGTDASSPGADSTPQGDDHPAPVSASASSTSAASSSPEDWREFVCKTWHLKPTMSFLTAGVFSEPIEPSVGVDYVLDKLGFKHANTTIPKWTQRGVMDPMDKLLSVMMRKFIQSLGEKEE